MRETTISTIARRRLTALLAAAAACLALGAPAASAAPAWEADVYWGPTLLQPGERGGFRLEIQNAGDETAADWPTVEIELPEGIEFDENDTQGGQGWQCSASGPLQNVICSNPIIQLLPPEIKPLLLSKRNTYVGDGFSGSAFPIAFTVDIAPGAPVGTKALKVEIYGAGASAASTIEEEVQIGGPPAGFGVRDGTFFAEALDEDGNPYTQAGGHPFEGVTGYQPTFKFEDPALNPSDSRWSEMIQPVAPPKDILVDLPPGFSGDALAVPTCRKILAAKWECPPQSQVGVAEGNQFGLPNLQMYAIYNVTPDRGSPAQMMFLPPSGGPVLLRPVVQSDGGWGLAVQTKGITEANPLFGVEIHLWGVPADSSHDDARCVYPSHIGDRCAGYSAGGTALGTASDGEPHSSTAPRRALITMPTECDGKEDVTTQHMSSWPDPGAYTPDGDPDLSDPDWLSYTATSPPVTGCESLEFEPTMKARPTTDAADSPTGLDVDLHIPQNMDPDGLATAHLRDVTVTLPEGLVVNPSGANGLGACSEEEVNLDNRLPDDCPEDSKIGKVLVETPVLEDPLPGAVYVAKPFDNPFDSLLAIYVTIDDFQTGIVGKIPGKVTPDPNTGRLTATFERNPQLPFEDFHLDFFGGAAASLRTPAICGTYATSSELTSYAAPDEIVEDKDVWQIAKGPNGQACPPTGAGLPNSPSFDAGSSSPIAGAHSPFVIELNRADGTQQFRSVTVSPPKGLLATLAGTANCPDSALAAAASKTGRDEQSSPSCPEASRVGTVVAGAGAGPTPYHAEGTVYLAGPHKGAPMSLAIVTPAVAGPFDLGTIVVRTAIHVDPKTAQITAVSDEIPTILQGIPLDVRSVSVRLDRPDFTLNPTSCEESSVGGTLTSILGNPVSLSERFQVGECHRLAFKPRLKLNLKGGSKRGAYQRLRAELRMPPGNANISRASVSLPRAFFLAQEHLNNICTRVQFAADQCPKASVYGAATAITPLLDEPLSGPVYLRSSDNELPDLVAALKGPDNRPIEVELVGRTDSHNRGIRNTFELVPDAPVSRFVLQLRGGSHSLIVNSTDICKNPQRATATFAAHNGRTATIRPKMRTRCGKAARKGKGKARGKAPKRR